MVVMPPQQVSFSLSSPYKRISNTCSDINKIIRCAYGTQTEYQALSIEALEYWSSSNAALSSGTCVPPGLTTSDKLFIQNGNLQITDKPSLPPFELASVKNMTAAGMGATQIVTSNAADVARAKQQGFAFGIDPFHRQERGLPYLALFDTTGGTAFADKACRFALHRARLLGVHFILGGPPGTFSSYLHTDTSDPTAITGLTTQDSVPHAAKLVKQF